MSWEDRLNNIRFKITTGDGRSFSPLWVSGEASVEFNAKKYEFIGVPGSLIDRKQPMGAKYPLTFFFQGEDNIEQADAFLKSAKDPRPWEIIHPFYGTILGQPLSLSRIDDTYNVTKFVVDFWETISEDYPNTQVSPRDIIASKVQGVNTLGIISYTSGAQPTSADISSIKENTSDVAAKFDRIQTEETFAEYKNAVSKAVNSLDNIIASPGEAIQSNQQILMLPSTYDIPVISRINAIYLAYLELKAVITGRNDKYYFESQGATLLSALSSAAITPYEEDFVTRDQVSEVNGILIGTYEDYLQTIDQAQVSRYDQDNEWVPNPQLQQSLYELITDTTAQLYQLAFGAKQERIIEVSDDTNLFILTHRYMGLDQEDKNLEAFRKINDIRNDELFKIKKGRKIKYFV